jgi:hypothetical protein
MSNSQLSGSERTVGAVGTVENSAVFNQEKFGYNAFDNTENILWNNS